MTKLKGYPEYKASGIEWIGDVPVGWDVKKLKYIAMLNPVRGRINLKLQEVKASFLPMEKVDTNWSNQPLERLYSEVCTGYTFFKDGDILVAKITPCFENGKGTIVNKLNNGFGFGSTEFHVIRVKSKASIKFLSYILRTTQFIQYGKNEMTGAAGQQRIPESYIEAFCIASPPLPEQQAIADFLDRETAHIDSIITKKTRLIELLKEKRQATITHAVTKGLNPQATMKDSGIEWIGEVPEGWEVKRLRNIALCQNGINKDGEYFGTGFPFLSYSDVYKNVYFSNKLDGLIESSVKEQQNYSVEYGDVFFTRTSETVEEIALSSVCMETCQQATFAGFLIRVRPEKGMLLPKFSMYFFRNEKNRAFFSKEMNSVTRASLSQELLKNLPTLIPPLPEQQAIADYLDKQCAAIDAIITKTQRSIELLKEKRQALITAAVTGQIDVRSW